MSRFKGSWRDCTMLPACLKAVVASGDLAMSSASWATEFQLRNLVRLKVANCETEDLEPLRETHARGYRCLRVCAA